MSTLKDFGSPLWETDRDNVVVSRCMAMGLARCRAWPADVKGMGFECGE